MDQTRRWQVVSVATAVAGLGIGGFALTRPSVEQVAPIELQLTDVAWRTAVPRVVVPGTEPPAPPSIVPVEPLERQVELSPTSPSSLASPEDPSATPPPSVTPRATPEPTATATAATPSPAPAPTDSPVSVDTPDSLDT